MKDNGSTPTPGARSSPNEFERDKPGTNARTSAEAEIERVRKVGGVFVSAIGATRMPMVLTDPNLPGNPIVFANQAFLGLSGYSMEEVLGQQPYFMNGPGTDPRDAARFKEALRAEQDDIIETIQYRKDGSRFVATVLLSAFKDENGNTLNHFMSWHDVTRRNAAEEEVAELRAARAELRESEAALRRSEHRGDSALLAANMGTWDYDLVADVCHFDARAQEMYNLPSDQLDHRRNGVALVVHPDDVQPMFDEISRATDVNGDGRYDIVYRIAQADDTYRWLRACGIAEFEGSGDARRAVRIVGASRDITLEREAEAALREGERLRTAMLDVLPLGLALTDQDGNSILTNSEWARFIPTNRIPSRDKERGARWRSWDEDGNEVSRENFPGARALRGERVHPPMEFLFRDDDDRDVWTSVGAVPFLDAEGSIAGAVCFIENIDEAKRAQEALRDSEEQLRLIVDSALDYAIFTTDLENRITSWLPGAQNVFGWSSEEAIGQLVDITFTPDDRAKGEPRKETEEARQTGTAPNVRWHVRNDGRRVYIEGHVIALRNEKGEVDAFLKIGQDVTDKHRASEMQSTLLAELQHRVRNILAMIQSVVQRTLHTSTTAEEYARHLAGRISAMARTQVLLTRSEDAHINLEDMIRDELLGAAATEDQFWCEGPEVALAAKAAEVLTLAVHELVTNSVKFGALSNLGGQIEIRWNVEVREGQQWLIFEWEEARGSDANLDREGFGTELITRRVPYELQGTGRLEPSPGGLTATVEFPLVRRGSILETKAPDGLK